MRYGLTLAKDYGKRRVAFGALLQDKPLHLVTGATHLVLSGSGSDAAPSVDALIGRRPGMLTLVRVWPEGAMAFRVRPTAAPAASR